MSDAMRCGLCGEEMRYNVPRLGPDGGFCHAATGSLTCKPMRLPARGEQVPQTVESLQAIMAADAVLMEKQGKEIVELKAKLNQAQQKNGALRTRIRCLQKMLFPGSGDGALKSELNQLSGGE